MTRIAHLQWIAVALVGTSACQPLPTPSAEDGSPSAPWSNETEIDSSSADASTSAGQCAPVASLSCGSYVSGDTANFNSGTTLELNGYPVGIGNYDGPEIAWVYRPEQSGEVTWRLVDPRPTDVDHDVFVLSGEDGSCAAESAIARGFNSVTFEAVAGQEYVLLIDGFAGDRGRFEATLSCDFEAGPAPECPVADPFEPTIEPGELYRCRDAQLNEGQGCGDDGYPRGYAAKYAEIFMWDLYPDVSVAAQDFLDANLQCLQEAFLDDTSPEMSCSDVAEVGFAAHPDCYIESGICGVPLSDKLAILNAVELGDLFHSSQLEAFAQIAVACY